VVESQADGPSAQNPSAAGSHGGGAAPPPADALCPFCGLDYRWDEGRRCWSCASPSCEHCATSGPEPLCPDCADAGASALPDDLSPMLATLGDLPADPAGWGFELKWDGIRCLAYWDGARLRLESRNGNGITARYPEIADIGNALSGRPAMVLDGEIVALDRGGRPSFALLQQRMHLSADVARHAAGGTPVHYFVFDVLVDLGESLLARPYRVRRAALAEHLPEHPHLHLPPSHDGAGRALLSVAREHGLEGIVAKRLDSPYEPGRRSPAWRKVKLVNVQEMVIGGWMPGGGAPGRIGSLLLGVYDETGQLRYIGRVGTGFTLADRQRLHQRLSAIERDGSPFDDPHPKAGARYVEPRLVAQVAYRRWPPGGQVQQASFKGLRPDVPPEDVVREEPAHES
jgi:bifunctional non-homologous end joining protein LigD